MTTRVKNIEDTKYPVLATKLYAPIPKPNLVHRIHLIEQLSMGINQKLTLISAPAGFGKTTLLSEWLSQSKIPVSWISLDKGDNDPVYFIKYVIAALQGIKSHIGEDALILLQSPQQPPIESIITSLIKEIIDIADEFVLVFDDYHSIETKKIHEVVEFLIDHLPLNMHLIIASRVDPPFPLARMRVRNQLTEFRVSDLCFTLDEISLFFNKMMNLGLSNDEITILESRTEGWIAGLQLAALSMQGRDDISSFIQTFAGDDRHIVDYLAGEVINRQPEYIQEFLLQTSILNRLSESLCNRIMEKTGSQSILEELERSNLFIIPLDNKRHWYRYHHLFGDLLRQRLNQTKGNKVNTLHRNASEWFEAKGYIQEAIEHALAAKEFERAAFLIEEFTFAKWHSGEQVTLFKWLDELPDEFKVSKPNLGLCHARVLFQSGQQEEAETFIDQLERTHINFPSRNRCITNNESKTIEGPASTDIQGRIAAIKAYMATRKGDISKITKYSRQALDYLSEEDSTWRSILATSSGIAHDLSGKSTLAIDAHYEAVEAAKKAGNVYLYLINRLWLAIGLKNIGRLPEAISICKQLLSEINDKTLTFNVALGHIKGAWGEMLYELNELDEAHWYAKKGIKHLEKGHDVSHLGWRYSCLVKILCSKNDLAGAEKIVPKMDELMRSSVIPPWVLTQIKAVKARIYLMKGNTNILVKWVKECGLKLDDESTWQRDAEQIMFARILIAQSRFDDASEFLNRLIAENKKAGRVLNQIETLVVQAQVFKKLNKEAKSIDALMKAFSLAEPGGYIRVFVDEGPPLAKLLEEILDTKQKIPREFVRKLLSAFRITELTRTDDELLEKLSGRELEVLRLIAAGLSNNKISEELFISLSTVKTHIRNIYGKLDVHSRTEAIVKGKELDLL